MDMPGVHTLLKRTGYGRPLSRPLYEKIMKDPIFKTDGDIEAAILHENKEAFAAIINKELYKVVGQPDDQNVVFHNSSCFDLFCIHVFELLAEKKMKTASGEQTLSVFTGSKWLAQKYKDQIDVNGLVKAIEELDIWLNVKSLFSFWCGDISKQIEFELSRRKILRFAQIFTKHNLLRIDSIIRELFEICNKAGCAIQELEVLHLLEPFLEELKENRIAYHSSYLIEMLHVYFTELNKVAYQLYIRSPTNRRSEMKYPDGISSDTFKDFYFSAVRFSASYNKAHYESLRPHTTEYLK